MSDITAVKEMLRALTEDGGYTHFPHDLHALRGALIAIQALEADQLDIASELMAAKTREAHLRATITSLCDELDALAEGDRIAELVRQARVIASAP